MKYKLLLVIPLALVVGAARAEDGGGGGGGEEEEGQSSKTFDASFNSLSSSNSGGANVSYTVNLTDAVVFSTNTSLSNGRQASDDSSSRDRSTSFSLDYDPPAPWRLGVNYGNSYNLFHRPPSHVYDEFKTEASSNSISSTLNYDASTNLKTNLSLSAADSYTRVILIGGTPPPTTSSQDYTAGAGFDYALTTSTSVKAHYATSIRPTDVEITRSKTYPPQPAKPIASRQVNSTLDGGVDSNKDLWEGFNLHTALNASRSATTDSLVEAFENDLLSGGASAAISWNPVSLLTITNAAEMNKSRQLYPNKANYRLQFNEDAYDNYTGGLRDAVQVKLAPSAKAEITLDGEYTDDKNELLNAGRLPPRESNNAGVCTHTIGKKVSSTVGVALWEDISFHMTYYLWDTHPRYLVTPESDHLSRVNNLDTTVGFDWTDDLRVDVATAMTQTLNRYDYYRTGAREDNDQVNVRLNTGFIYDLSTVSSLEFHADISKSETRYLYEEALYNGYSEINRHFSAKARRDFGRVFKPDCTVDMTLTNTFAGNSLFTNKRKFAYSIAPAAEFNTSEALSLRTTFSFAREDSDKVYNATPDDWERRDTYGSSLGIVYNVAENLVLNFSSSHSHAATVSNRFRRFRVYPNESFFNVDARLSYTF